MAYYFVKKKKRLPKYTKKIAGVLIICCGISILLYFFFPLFIYQLVFTFTNSAVEIPVPKYAMVGNENTFVSEMKGVGGLTTDFNDARNWYPTVHVSKNTPTAKYTLSIPSLKIQNAEVSTVDYDLSKHLVQYAGTSIPGDNGTSVIFGHSTLPQWFDPKNYKTIFATLHKIKNGDEIYATVNGIKYAYKVFSITITSPEDTNMFEQSYDHSYITIVTCTPPGTVWKRLIVRASLEDLGNKTSQNKSSTKGTLTFLP